MSVAVRINDALGKFPGIWGGPAAKQARALGSELYGGIKGNLKTGRFAVQAAASGATGAVAGYAYGQDMQSTIKGAGLGVLGAVGYQAGRAGMASYRNGRLGEGLAGARAGISKEWSRMVRRGQISDALAAGKARRVAEAAAASAKT